MIFAMVENQQNSFVSLDGNAQKLMYCHSILREIFMNSQVYSAQSANRELVKFVKELTLCEMLDDPIVQDVMGSDGVSRSDVLAAYKIKDCKNFARAA